MTTVQLYAQENFCQGHVTALSNRNPSCLQADQNHCGLFWGKTCPEPANKTTLCHRWWKSCWLSHCWCWRQWGTVLPPPDRWYDRSRRVGESQSTLIKSVPLQKHCSNVCKGGGGGGSTSSSRSAWRKTPKTVCTEMLSLGAAAEAASQTSHHSSGDDWMHSTTSQINFSWERAPRWTEYYRSGLRKTVTLKNGKIIN